MTHFEYEGNVALRCQEGGFAESSVELLDLSAEKSGKGLGATVRGFIDPAPPGKQLADVIEEEFAEEDVSETNRFGDVILNKKLRIVIEER